MPGRGRGGRAGVLDRPLGGGNANANGGGNVSLNERFGSVHNGTQQRQANFFNKGSNQRNQVVNQRRDNNQLRQNLKRGGATFTVRGVQQQRGGRGGPRRGGRGGRGGNRNNRGGKKEKLSAENLDKQLDSYMSQNANYQQDKLDADLDEYMKERGNEANKS